MSAWPGTVETALSIDFNLSVSNMFMLYFERMNCIRHPMSAYAKNNPLAVLTETKYNFLKLVVVVVVVVVVEGGGVIFFP